MNKHYMTSALVSTMLLTLLGCGSSSNTNSSELEDDIKQLQQDLNTTQQELNTTREDLVVLQARFDVAETSLNEFINTPTPTPTPTPTTTPNSTPTATPTAAPSSTDSKVKKTGQTISYDLNGTKTTAITSYDDGHYQSGANHSYTREGNAVIDNITQLMWQDNNQVSVDKKQWLTDSNYRAKLFDDKTGDTATTYCNSLSLEGYSDWRLPTVKELQTIIDYGQRSPALPSTIFQNTNSSTYWTSVTAKSTAQNNEAFAWAISFSVGKISVDNKNEAKNIRCVRTN